MSTEQWINGVYKMNSWCLDSLLEFKKQLSGIETVIMAIKDPRKLGVYDPDKYKNKELTEKQKDLFEELMGDTDSSGGGGGKPPRRGGDSGLPIDNYEKEKADIKRYFSADIVKSVLKSKDDELYAAMGVRFLNSMNKKLDNYEIHILTDYRLELLKRAGRFCEEANVFQRIQQGDIRMIPFKERVEAGYIFRVTPSPPEKVFGKGFDRQDLPFPDTHAHVWEYGFDKRDGYVSTHKELGKEYEVLFMTWFRKREEGGFGITVDDLKEKPLYLYTLNPRALTGVDIEFSAETFKKPIPEFNIKGYRVYDLAFVQKEAGVLGVVDRRDVKNVFKVEYDGKKISLTNMKTNESYIMSHWELPGT
ncbi:MAG: hypothetical protein L6408_03260 [Nanoarchaeota archaeon]|nr:hypothetical protein [Nanoarchaeota archaeon]